MTNSTQLLYRPAEITDADSISKLRNDFETLMFLSDVSMFPATQTAEWIKNLPRSSQRIVVEDETHDFVGLIRIDNIDETNRNCMVGLDIAGSFRGSGLATQIYAWLIDYLFNQKNFNALYLEVLSSNARARHIYETIGFQKCGEKRQALYRNGSYQNVVMMEMLRDEAIGNRP